VRFGVALGSILGKGRWMRCRPALLALAFAASGALGGGMANAAGGSGQASARSGAPKSASSAKPSTSKSASSAKKSGKKRSSRLEKRKRGKRIAKSSSSSKSSLRKKSKRSREVSRTPNRRTASNMPRGWSWPPNKTMVKAGEQCLAALDAAGVAWKRASVEGKIGTPIVLDSLDLGGVVYHPTFRKPPFPMDCHLALALVMHSPTLHDLGVRKVNFGSIFRFTKVRAHGKTKNVLSRHALGLAMDVVSFEDQDGVVVDVERDYPLGAELLLAVEDTLNGSGGFRTVLTPRNDPTSHHDHFHIEADVSYYDEHNVASLRSHGESARPAQ
jgi:hypothetical protein